MYVRKTILYFIVLGNNCAVAVAERNGDKKYTVYI
jgi:hypothetical protein